MLLSYSSRCSREMSSDCPCCQGLKEKLAERSGQIEALAGEQREDAQSELDLLKVLVDKLK